ncbi:unnamed protein product [Debaryomyces tyrocola]|nr:unnamed protein product [Debaryomyces tyrocola]
MMKGVREGVELTRYRY